MLELKKISKIYKTNDFEQNALKEVSLKFRKHEFVTILGPSGSGKTTLLNIIGGLDKYSSGDLVINDKSTKKFKDKDWDAYRNNCVGFVFQNYNLIGHLNILENVMMGMTLSGVDGGVRKDKAIKVLQRVGLENHKYKKPNQLSGGQMQRVAIARAIVNDPDIILADEPTGALDSKTSKQIMDLIREIANEELVIMVSHNEDLAKDYSTRIIKLKDGEIVEDTNPINKKEESDKKFDIKKTSMSFLTALKLSFNNILTKKGRTILTSFASSIGIIGIALILSLSNGFDKQIDTFQSNTLSNFPVMITEQVMNVDIEKIQNENKKALGITEETKYPTEKFIYPYNSLESIKVHTNKLTNEYIEYVENVDSNYIAGVSYVRMNAINISNKVNGEAKLITNNIKMNSLPKTLDDNSSFIVDNFDVLSGEFPKNSHELVLMVDEENRVEKSMLDALGIDTSNEKISFDDLIGMELKIIINDVLYKSMGNFFVMNTDLNKIYDDENNITLKIVGVIRGKEDNSFSKIMSSMSNISGDVPSTGSILYSEELANELIEVNSKSNIVKVQNESDYNVLTGEKFVDNNEKETLIKYFGGSSIPTMINIYPKDFDSKEAIIDYLEEYNNKKDEIDKIVVTDMAETVTSLTGNIMDAITIVLIAFSAISLVVSSIMIGIITYISVLERTKEIGILRALGARKKDITRVFNAETCIIGLFSGFLGVIIARLILIPANMILLNLTDLKNVAVMNPLHAFVLILVSLILTMIGGALPARIASKKDPVIALRTE